MVERLKSWESPRKRGRNDKGKGGSARARQLRKREKLLRKKLKAQKLKAKKQNANNSKEGEAIPPFFCVQADKDKAMANCYGLAIGCKQLQRRTERLITYNKHIISRLLLATNSEPTNQQHIIDTLRTKHY